jgi:hypothetical protein
MDAVSDEIERRRTLGGQLKPTDTPIFGISNPPEHAQCLEPDTNLGYRCWGNTEFISELAAACPAKSLDRPQDSELRWRKVQLEQSVPCASGYSHAEPAQCIFSRILWAWGGFCPFSQGDLNH